MKLYLVTRRDLPPGARAAQLCHALREFVEKHRDEDRAWFEASNTLVLLETENEGTLSKLASEAIASKVPAAEFREPDLNDSLTAIAIGPSGRKLVRELRLAFS
jgi:peptidyl-tRNA hydrolase